MKTATKRAGLRGAGVVVIGMCVGAWLPVVAAEPAVTISEKTTRITAPLRKDGFPDYVAALNEICAEGVTADNNAALLFMQAFGPTPIHEAMRPRFFRMLGIEEPPGEGAYLVDFDSFRRRHLAGQDESIGDVDAFATLQDAYSQAMERPWAADEFPEVAAWVEANAGPLALVVEGTKRPRFYAPMISAADDGGSDMVIMVLLPVLQELREAARLLKARAMLRIQEGDLDAAWQDLLACHRLGRLAAQDPTLIGALVGIAIDSVAINGDTWIASDGRLSAAVAERIVADLQTLEPFPPMVESLDTAERFAFLDAVCAVASGRASLSDLTGDGSVEPPGWVTRTAAAILVDWDSILRKGNRWYDRMVATAELPTFRERREAFAVIEGDLDRLGASVRDARNVWSAIISPRATVSEQLGNVFVSLLLPALSAAMEAEGRAMALGRMNEVTFALAAFRAEHGTYPATLADLQQEQKTPLPRDPFSEEAFRYRREGEGFVVYSVGPNLRDDEGKVYYLDRDENGEPGQKSEWDDFRIQVPPSTEGSE